MGHQALLELLFQSERLVEDQGQGLKIIRGVKIRKDQGEWQDFQEMMMIFPNHPLLVNVGLCAKIREGGQGLLLENPSQRKDRDSIVLRWHLKKSTRNLQ